MRFWLLTKVLILVVIFNGHASATNVKVGAERMGQYLPDLQGKTIGVVANHTSLVNGTHLVDTLLAKGIDVKRIFSPEHGFRGKHGAGETVKNNKDTKTGLPVFSLYGSTKKPTPESLEGIEVMVFDIQDVGCRFYTYISTMHYVMEAAAEADIPVIVLDRPNPNGYFIDGPVLEEEFKSFVGMHPVPIVYGMTIGEYARMINGEGWLKNGIRCDLTVIELENYDHETEYELPVAPSPNLPNMDAVYLYPSLCLFEGTDVSVGRGTDWPFQVIGKPGFEEGKFTFTPRSIPGVAPNPPYEGKACKGFKLTTFCNEYIRDSGEIYLYWLTGFYNKSDNQSDFFNNYFDKLAGTDKLRKQVKNGVSVSKIEKSWQDDLEEFKQIREKYLLYKDFQH